MTLDASTLKKWRELVDAASDRKASAASISKAHKAILLEAPTALTLLLDAYEKLQAENERLQLKSETYKVLSEIKPRTENEEITRLTAQLKLCKLQRNSIYVDEHPSDYGLLIDELDAEIEAIK